MVLIKRYANRKLYDCDKKKYVTLKEIFESINHGEQIRVIDHLSGEDLTTQIMAQIVQKQKLSSKGAFSRALLEEIIRSVPSPPANRKLPVTISHQISRMIETELKKRLQTLENKGLLSPQQTELLHAELLSNLPAQFDLAGIPEEAILITSSELEQCLDSFDLPSLDDLSILNQQLQDLFRKVENLSIPVNQI
jgi:polyhydroxyalkanoate synthesis repressor PhaR